MSDCLEKHLNELNGLLAEVARIRCEAKDKSITTRTKDGEKSLQQRIEDIEVFVGTLPQNFAEMACAGGKTKAPCVHDDDLWDLKQELQGIIAEETAIRDATNLREKVIGFWMEPLRNGDILIRFWGSEYGYTFNVGARVLSSECFAELAKANPQKATGVNTLISQSEENQKKSDAGESEASENSVIMISDEDYLRAIEEMKVASEAQAEGGGRS